MIEIGDQFEVDGKVGMVCFKGSYFDDDYICLAYEDEGKFGIYKVVFSDNKFYVTEEKNDEKKAYVLSQFVTDEIIKE